MIHCEIWKAVSSEYKSEKQIHQSLSDRFEMMRMHVKLLLCWRYNLNNNSESFI